MKRIISHAQEKLKTTRFFVYCFFGALAALVELGSFFIMTNLLEGHYLLTTPISFVFGATTNFILQRKFTFKNKETKKHVQYAVFLTIALGGLLINWVATAFYVEVLHLIPLGAKVLAIITALGYNYTMNKHITFKKKYS